MVSVIRVGYSLFAYTVLLSLRVLNVKLPDQKANKQSRSRKSDEPMCRVIITFSTFAPIASIESQKEERYWQKSTEYGPQPGSPFLMSSRQNAKQRRNQN